MADKPLFVQWCAKEALEGMAVLRPEEELAYRRIIDFIYSTNDELYDEDDLLSEMTRTGENWPKIKERLVRLKKIRIENGFIRNTKCTEKLEKAQDNIEQKRLAGIKSAEARKQQKSANDSTDVATDVITSVPTNHQLPTTNQNQVRTPPYPLVTGSRQAGGLKPLVFGEGGEEFDIRDHLDDQTLAAARKAAPMWDIYGHLAQIYNDGINEGRRERPRSPEKAFPAWCGKYTKGKSP